MNNQIPSGVYPTMITPYTTDNKIDYNAVEALLNWYDGRVDGVFAICQSSEIFFLSFEEKLELLKFIMAHKPKDMAVVASGHTEDDFDTQVKQAAAYIETGIDAYVFISNRFATKEESDDVLLDRMFKAIDLLPETRYGVYECPHNYNRQLTPYVMKQMAQSGKFCFLKDTSCNLDRIAEKLEAVKGSDFKIYNANAATMLESMKLGCEGFSGIMANFYPEIFREICRCYKTDPDRAQMLQNFAGFCSLAEGQRYSCNSKYFFSLEGLPMTIHSRSTNPDSFSKVDRMMVEQFHALVDQFEKVAGMK